MTPANFMAALKASFDRNIAAETAAMGTPLADCTVSGNNLVFTELYMPWRLGKMSVATLPFDVVGETVNIDAIDVEWAQLAVATVTKDSSDTTAGAEKLADLEWFCLGERGDIYRGVGWPNNFETKYQIDATGATAYSVADITYFYMGNNEDIQHSRKTITIAFDGASATNVANTLEDVFPNAVIKIDGAVYGS